MSLRKNHTLKSCKIRVGITIGDPAGVGPAITLKALDQLKGLADFVVIGDAWVLSNSKLKLKTQNVEVIDLGNVPRKDFRPGTVSARNGQASMEYLEEALRLLRQGRIDCLVTCPISKEAINKAGFKFSGHTEFFKQRTGAKDIVMMLLNRRLKFSLVTRHVSLKNVSHELKKDNLSKTVVITYNNLRDKFALPRPRIVVCGLNPHASDNGLIGNEENIVIKPVLKTLRSRLHFCIDGPMPSDSAIYKAKNKAYDCVIAMYHDQALIPLKLTGIDSGVNLTLGLPFTRTSPLHGTAFDIARDPSLANPNSLIEAVRLAVKCTSSPRKD